MRKQIASCVLAGWVLSAAASLAYAAEEQKNLEAVLKKQDQILETLEEIKRELNVVKIRVSSKG